MSESSRLPGQRGEAIKFEFDGRSIDCFRGETIATALLAADVHAFNTLPSGGPRQPLCNMGTCFDCSVVVDGAPLTRACLTDAVEGMYIQSQKRV